MTLAGEAIIVSDRDGYIAIRHIIIQFCGVRERLQAESNLTGYADFLLNTVSLYAETNTAE